ncbi:dirigent protein 16-like [Populus alba x Populus x berolinensis]|uniref:Dirigent protein n=1 Tax=Populus alba x Populus x berolinensis TaxID=444605 RepID=A0AAD6RAF3_9ROSI|nr:dirigent protein 16-like [Populus alba x Populus x berolinensis]
MFKISSPYFFIAVLIAALHTAIYVAAIEPVPAGGEPVLELYMHDILGGSNPTARPITGLLGNIYSGQVPFARPVGFVPPKGAVAIPNSNGALPTVNGLNGIPLGTGLAGTTFADGSTQMMAFTAMFEGGEFGDSLNFYGIYRIGSAMSRLSVTGGTGKFKNAIGFAEVRGLIPSGQAVTDGAETLLRIAVHLKY